MSEVDLETFRQEWKKELKKLHDEEKRNDQEDGSKSSQNEGVQLGPDKKETQDGISKSTESESQIHDEKQSHSNSISSSATSSHSLNQTSSSLSSLYFPACSEKQTHTSRVGEKEFAIEHEWSKHRLDSDDESSQHSVSGPSTANSTETEYYPFKILTQFLNEAPKKARPISKKEGSKPTEMTYVKRKYFKDLNIEEKKKKHKSLTGDGDHSATLKRAKTEKANERYLDLFIADLDEINEIPFFDTTIPRELAMKIFQHLDMKSLCSCSQVSKSWKHLADDELLWCRICHKLGYDNELSVCESVNWKSRVQQYTEQKALLISNWKARVGKPYYLQYARGGVLCAVSSCGPHIVAGYTSCNIRIWDTESGDICTLNASNTSLVIDERTEDLGLIHNEVKGVCMTPSHTAASFQHGFVDIWHNEEGTDPVHTMTFRGESISSLTSLELDSSQCVIAASQNRRVQVVRCRGQECVNLCDFDTDKVVNKLCWSSTSHRGSNPVLLITSHSSLHLKPIELNPGLMAHQSFHAEDQQLIEVHNIIWAPISCVQCRNSEDEVAVGFTSPGPFGQECKVNIYDLTTRGQRSTLTGHTWLISCMDLPEELPNQLVSGSGDRKIRVYDTRASEQPMSILTGHIAKVTCVQMDDWKVVSGDEAGFVCVWDQRMRLKLWDIHNRHPVEYCHFQDRLLVVGNVPYQKFPGDDEFENMSSVRYRGTVQVYDFFANQQRQGIPDICLSSYNEPEAYDYNISLAVPYDTL